MSARVLVERTIEDPEIRTVSTMAVKSLTVDVRVDFAYGDHERALVALGMAVNQVRRELEEMRDLR